MAGKSLKENQKSHVTFFDILKERINIFVIHAIFPFTNFTAIRFICKLLFY